MGLVLGPRMELGYAVLGMKVQRYWHMLVITFNAAKLSKAPAIVVTSSRSKQIRCSLHSCIGLKTLFQEDHTLSYADRTGR